MVPGSNDTSVCSVGLRQVLDLAEPLLLLSHVQLRAGDFGGGQVASPCGI